MTSQEVDVAIIGGGMVGASLALALRGTAVRTLLIEGAATGSAEQSSFDARTTALGNASRRIFEGLGIWDRLVGEAAAIRAIHISDAGRFGFARLHAAEHGIEAFGYVVPNRAIGAALWDELRDELAAATNVLVRTPARAAALQITPDQVSFTLTNLAEPAQIERVTAKLVVAADGAHSVVRSAAAIAVDVHDYDQTAIVANVAAAQAHDGTAYERFTSTGPVAVLPLRDGSYGVIWTCTPERAREVLNCDDRAFLCALQERFGWRAGRFVRAGTRAAYPLKLMRATTTVGVRTVLIGNAAQALHPVAGQGFNLGLRDAAMLAEVLACRDAEPGSAQSLQQFARWRAADRRGVVGFTDGLVRLFGDTRPALAFARNLGLLLFDLAPPAKAALARLSAGFAGPTPRLARGLSVCAQRHLP
ncbi:MAG TPA: 2-octaprenyl-6-methoxyphenyl hydroxylase [Steroidobacteraceae bacterium]